MDAQVTLSFREIAQELALEAKAGAGLVDTYERLLPIMHHHAYIDAALARARKRHAALAYARNIFQALAREEIDAQRPEFLANGP